MKYKIHDTMKIKNMRFELIEESFKKFWVIKIYNSKVTHFHLRPFETLEDGRAAFKTIIERKQ